MSLRKLQVSIQSQSWDTLVIVVVVVVVVVNVIVLVVIVIVIIIIIIFNPLMFLMALRKPQVYIKFQRWDTLVIVVVFVVVLVIVLVVVVVVIDVVVDVLDVLDVLLKTTGFYQVPEVSYEAWSILVAKHSIMYYGGRGAQFSAKPKSSDRCRKSHRNILKRKKLFWAGTYT